MGAKPAAGIASLPFALTSESVGDIVPTGGRLRCAHLCLAARFAFLPALYPEGVERPRRVLITFMPPLGMLFGWLLLGEHVSPLDLLGIVPVVLGIYLVTRG